MRRVQERDKVAGVIAGSKFIGRDITTEYAQGDAAYLFERADESFGESLEEVADPAASLKLIVAAEVAGGNEIVNMIAAASWSGETSRKPKVCAKYLRTEGAKLRS